MGRARGGSAPTRPAGLLRAIREYAGAAADVVVPLECAGCAAAGAVLCEACTACLLPTELGGQAPALDGSFPVWGCGYYEGPPRRAVLAWKTGGRRDVEARLAPALARTAAILWAGRAESPGGSPVLVVPMPSSAKRRLRGRPDVTRLADPVAAGVAAAGRDAVVVRALAAARWAGPGQRGRGQRARTAQARPQPRTRLDLTGETVLLVDDVLTTGATLAACAVAVRRAGGVVAGAVVVVGARVRGRRTGGNSPTHP